MVGGKSSNRPRNPQGTQEEASKGWPVENVEKDKVRDNGMRRQVPRGADVAKAAVKRLPAESIILARLR